MYIYHARVALRQNQTLKSICHDLINSQTSKLLWCDKRKEEEKLNPWPHTHTLCMKSKHSWETFKSLANSVPQKHSVSHAHPAAAHVDRPNSVSVTHTAYLKKTKWQPQAAQSFPVQDHPQVMFMNWEEQMDASLFHHFPLPYPHRYQWAANRKVLSWSSSCLLQSSHLHACADEIVLKGIKATAISDEEKLWCNQNTHGKVWLITDWWEIGWKQPMIITK